MADKHAAPRIAGPGGGAGDDSRADDRACGDRLTAAYQEYLAVHGEVPGGPLLAQTAAIAPLRRAFADHIAVEPGAFVVDVGCGFGPVAFELAHRSALRVAGVDRDAGVLGAASRIGASLGSWLGRTSDVVFAKADLHDLPFAAGSADAVTASLVFQHLADPRAAIVEARRVLRAGGRLFVFDVDDGLGASYPESEELARLERAFARWQHGSRGDREIGRKLPVLMAENGFRVTGMAVVPSAALLLTAPQTSQRALTGARLASAGPEMVGAGLLSACDLEGALRDLERAPARLVSRIEARVVAVGTRV